MRCSAFRTNILRWSDGEAPAVAQQKTADDHLAQCNSCAQWKEYQKVLENGPEDEEIPPFKMSPRVSQAIGEASMQAKASPRFRFVPSFQFSAAVSMIILIGIVGIYRFAIYKPSEAIRTTWVQTDGQAYQVISSGSSNDFDPNYLKSMATPALQNQVSRQLGFLSDPLASALRNASESMNWAELRRELEEQELDIHGEQPKFLALSKQLTELLQTDTRDVEIWIIQPADSVLLFALMEDEGW